MQASYMQDIIAISPLLILTIGALATLLIDVFSDGKPWPRGTTVAVFIICAFASLVGLIADYTPGNTVFSGLLYADPYALFSQIVILGGAILSVMLGIGSLQKEGVESEGEYYSLLMMAVAGSIIFVTAAELITLFLGLEIMSMALYCLCGSALKSRNSSESALKYFLLGSFSSALMLYGIALSYGVAGSTSIEHVASFVNHEQPLLLSVGIGLMLIGFIFKVGAVPFHFWAPDVYQGAPTPITAFMASVIKASAVAITLRVFWTFFADFFSVGAINGMAADMEIWRNLIGIIAVLTMIVGNLVALRQRSLKRMLAYSSIAHAGYILVAFLAPDKVYGGGAAVLYYLVAYTLMTLGAFGVVLAVTSGDSESGSDDITKFNALSSARPFLAALMAIFMLSLAGIPPGMAGLLGKFYVFSAAVKAGFVGIAIVGVVCSAISCYYYLRVIVAMYFVPESETSELAALDTAELPLPLGGVLVLCAVGVVVIGLFPSGIYAAAAQIVASI